MKHFIALETWKRKQHFQHFCGFDDPYFGITTTVDCTHLYSKVKEEKGSFFLSSLHLIMRAANSVEEFRYRIEEGRVVCYDTIHVSPTVGRDDDTFGFSFFPYSADLSTFLCDAKEEITRVRQSVDLFQPGENAARIDTVYFSSVPWISFSDMKHPVSIPYRSSVPQISVGKLQQINGALMMPISVGAHHGLMDGLHVARFLEKLQKLLNE